MNGREPGRRRPRDASAMRIYAEESFGPIVAVIRVSGDDEAIRAANDSEYGLAAAVFSQNIINRALHVARRGSTPGSATSTARPSPTRRRCRFGGTKASGYGPTRQAPPASRSSRDLRWITIETAPALSVLTEEVGKVAAVRLPGT